MSSILLERIENPVRAKMKFVHRDSTAGVESLSTFKNKMDEKSLTSAEEEESEEESATEEHEDDQDQEYRTSHKKQIKEQVQDQHDILDEQYHPPKSKSNITSQKYLNVPSATPTTKQKRSNSSPESTGKRKRKSRQNVSDEKDKNAPKKPSNAYLVFSNSEKEKMKLTVQPEMNLSSGELTKVLGQRWKGMTDIEKQVKLN